MKYFVIFIAAFGLLSCNSNSNLLEDAAWLDGNWTREYNGIVQMEKWNVSSTGFTGQNLFVSSDTNVMNTYKINKVGTNWELVKSVSETDIQFKYSLISSNTDSIVFKNTLNTWPQTITYKKLNSNKMDLIVNGQDGTMRKTAALTFSRKL